MARLLECTVSAVMTRKSGLFGWQFLHLRVNCIDRRSTFFSIEKLGYEEALAEAIKHRQKYHLFKGMYFGFEGVAPDIRKVVAKKE